MTIRRAVASVLTLVGGLILLLAVLAAIGGDLRVAPFGLLGLLLLGVGLKLLLDNGENDVPYGYAHTLPAQPGAYPAPTPDQYAGQGWPDDHGRPGQSGSGDGGSAGSEPAGSTWSGSGGASGWSGDSGSGWSGGGSSGDSGGGGGGGW
ncbi:hypothetical protein [Micromonospora fluostatini]|uniref:hypothetical protein n=1 Tax=Micromonospora sp. JCM 30529 TaxID=3421643 RepID=UPI003D17C64C